MTGICCKVETWSLKKKLPPCKVPNDKEEQNKGEMSVFYFILTSLPPQPDSDVKEKNPSPPVVKFHSKQEVLSNSVITFIFVRLIPW